MYYKGVIWTTHAKDRLGQRGMTEDMAWQAFRYPDSSENGKQAGTTEFRKHFGRSLVTVIAKQNEKHEWVIISCWIDPPFAGTEDAKKREQYLEYKKATGLRKFFLILRRQLGF